jgi:hypothetical protein
MAMWCCLGFEGHYNQAGQRGTGILVRGVILRKT